MAAKGPVVLEVIVDKDIPPVPPHIETQMAKKTAKALLKDPDRVDLARKGAKQKIHEFTESVKTTTRRAGEGDR